MEDREFSWEDTVEVSDEQEFNAPILLDEGDYNFTVTNIERGISKTSGKNMATVTLNIGSEKGSVDIKDYFPLTQRAIWKLQRFTLAVGTRTHNEPLILSQLNQVIGKKGRCHVIVEEFETKRGTTGHNNKVDAYYDYVEPTQPTPAEQAAQATVPW